VPSAKFTLPVDLEGGCCIRSDNRVAINEVACKIEGFILRQSPCPGPVETIPASFAPNFQPVQAADCREPFAVLSSVSIRYSLYSIVRPLSLHPACYPETRLCRRKRNEHDRTGILGLPWTRNGSFSQLARAARYRLLSCPSSGGASPSSRSALRLAVFSSLLLCFSSVRARAALSRSRRSLL